MNYKVGDLVEVERLKTKDISSYKDFIKDVFGYDTSRKNIMKAMKKSIILVLRLDNKVISSITLDEEVDYVKDKRYYYASYFGVLTDYRRMGFATKIFEYVEELIKTNNIDYIELTSGNQRKEAHNFYSRHNFRVKDTTVFIKFYK